MRREARPGGRQPKALVSPRELEVLELIAAGYTYRAIAAELYRSESTVRRQVENIAGKLGTHSKAHSVAVAYQLGILSIENAVTLSPELRTWLARPSARINGVA
jgi:DNA-binding NarL/FixJ family response regulator